MCQGFSHFSVFLHHFVLAKLATNSIRVKRKNIVLPAQGLSQDLKTGCPKLIGNCEMLGHPIFQGRSQYTHITLNISDNQMIDHNRSSDRRGFDFD